MGRTTKEKVIRDYRWRLYGQIASLFIVIGILLFAGIFIAVKFQIWYPVLVTLAVSLFIALINVFAIKTLKKRIREMEENLTDGTLDGDVE